MMQLYSALRSKVLLRVVLGLALLLFLKKLFRIEILRHSPYGNDHPYELDGVPLRFIYEFTNNVQIGALSARDDGRLLTAIYPEPEVWTVDPASGEGVMLYRFESLKSIVGVVAVGGQELVILTCNSIYSHRGACNQLTAWTTSLWESGEGVEELVKLTTITGLRCPAGSIYLTPNATSDTKPYRLWRKRDEPPPDDENSDPPPEEKGHILLADECLGVIFAIDLSTGLYNIAAEDELFKPRKGTAVPRGINDIATTPSTSTDDDAEDNGKWQMFFTNTFGRPFLGQIHLDADRHAVDAAKTLVIDAPRDVNPSGLALDESGNAWVGSKAADSLFRVDSKTRVVKNIASKWPAAALNGTGMMTFGKTRKDRTTLYLTTGPRKDHAARENILPTRIMALDTGKLVNKGNDRT